MYKAIGWVILERIPNPYFGGMPIHNHPSFKASTTSTLMVFLLLYIFSISQNPSYNIFMNALLFLTQHVKANIYNHRHGIVQSGASVASSVF